MKEDAKNTNVVQDDIVVADKFHMSDLLCKEDWLAIWGAFIIMAVAAVGVITGAYKFKGVSFGKWGGDKGSIMKFFDFGETCVTTWGGILVTFLALAVIFIIANKLMGKNAAKYAKAFVAVFALTALVRLISSQVTFSKYLEYAFWALLIGLLISNVLKVPEWLKPAIQTEFYIKTGLVLMGASVLFSNIQKFGLYGLGIAWLVTPVVIIFMWLLGTRGLKMENKRMVITIAAATSVCGTSAAIATAAACKAKKTDLTFAVGISLIFTVLMMVCMPLFCKAIAMDPMVGGAWIGGTVDSTGAVVLAGNALGELAGQVAALVKMIQNILIGFIAFAVAIFFTTKVDKTEGTTVGASEIWHRFPKFILGFIGASLFFSFVFQGTIGVDATADILSCLKEFQTWCFALAFTCIGLETNFKEMSSQFQGGKPFVLYIVGQTFNLVLTFVVAWLLLSGRFFPVPNIMV
ncbi:MAG: putative sulfate exporter family transporter [Brotaphodocola sp.]